MVEEVGEAWNLRSVVSRAGVCPNADEMGIHLGLSIHSVLCLLPLLGGRLFGQSPLLHIKSPPILYVLFCRNSYQSILYLTQ